MLRRSRNRRRVITRRPGTIKTTNTMKSLETKTSQTTGPKPVTTHDTLSWLGGDSSSVEASFFRKR